MKVFVKSVILTLACPLTLIARRKATYLSTMLYHLYRIQSGKIRDGHKFFVRLFLVIRLVLQESIFFINHDVYAALWEC